MNASVIIFIVATLIFGTRMLWLYMSKRKKIKDKQLFYDELETTDNPSTSEIIINHFHQPIGDLWDRIWEFAFPFSGFVSEQERSAFVDHLWTVDYSEDWSFNIGKVFEALQKCPSTDWQLVVAFNSAQLKMFIELIKNSDEEHPVYPNVYVWYAFHCILDTMLIEAGYK